MDVKVTLKPGQPGTKGLLELFGERLVCVRYRYDPRLGKRFKTAEIVVDEQLWQDNPAPKLSFAGYLPPADARALIKVAFDEYELRAEIKRRGGVWLPAERLWELPYDDVASLGLRSRIVRMARQPGQIDV